MARDRYRLKLSKLDFVSLVDNPAQPNATTLLIKRDQRTGVGKRGDAIEATAKYVKASDELGLAFFWAFTSKVDGADHFDLQGDTVDEDFVKAAMEFMEHGGAVDEMHDYEATKARVVFAMPMTPDIAKAYGVTSSTTGLMVAIKCTAEQLAKLKSGEYTGVSIAGLGTREPVETSKRKVAKQVSLYTDEVDGHQHQIDVCDDGSLWCSWATSAGADNSHTHAVSRDEAGTLVILADSGHTHALAEGQPAVIVVPEGAVIVTEVAMRSPTTNAATAKARASESSRAEPARKVTIMQTKSTSEPAAQTADHAAEIERLTKANARLDRIAKMTGAHKTYFDTLAADVADAFLAKGMIERNQEIEEVAKANPIEFVLDGIEYRKSTQGYALAKRIREQDIELKKADVAKRSTEMLGGASDVQCSIVRAFDVLGAEERDAATKYIKGLVATSRIDKKAPGFDGASVDGDADPAAALEQGLAKFCDEQKIDKSRAWTVGLPRFQATTEGAALVRAFNESR